jgi:hypothetical protein
VVVAVVVLHYGCVIETNMTVVSVNKFSSFLAGVFSFDTLFLKLPKLLITVLLHSAIACAHRAWVEGVELG